MAERELGIVLRAKDLASKTIANVNRQLGNIGSNVSRGLGNAVRNVERGIAAISVAALGGIAYSLRAAGDFEAQLNTINTVAQATPEVLGTIGEGIRKLARDTGTSHADLTTAYYDLVSAGIKAADAQNVLTAANTLAIGGLSTTAEAVDLLTTAINSYGGDATKAGLYADQFAQAIAAGKVTAAELAASFAQVGPMAAAMGIGIDEISASIGLMTAKGTPAAEAFTQIRAAMTALQRQTPEMKRVLGELGIADAQLYADTYGLAPLFDKLRAKADELGIPMIELTGRIEGTQYALQNTGPEFQNYLNNLDDVANSSGTAADQMSERQQGLNYQLGLLRTNLHDAAITIGSRLLPKITPLVQKMAEWAQQNQAGIGKFADDLAGGIERAVTWAQSLDWSLIANSLRSAAGFAKSIGEAFLGLPSWIQVAVVTGWGLNKLTGGALGSILGNLRGSSPLTPMYTKEVGFGGGVGGGPGTAGRGRGGGLLLGLTGAGLAGLLADEFEEEIQGLSEDIHDSLRLPDLPGPDDWQWPFGTKNTPTILPGVLPEVFGPNGLLGGTPAIDTPESALDRGARPTPPPPTVAGGGYDPNAPFRDTRPDPRAVAPFGIGALQALIAQAKAMVPTLPDTAMQPLVGALEGLTVALSPGRSGFGIGAMQDFISRAEQRLQGGGGIFVESVKLDPSQVTDLREPTRIAAEQLREILAWNRLQGSRQEDELRSSRGVISGLPPILERANATLSRVAGIGDRHQAQLAAQAGKLAAIEGISGRIASSAAISAAKNFSPTVNVPVKVDNHISIHEWQRTVQSSARAYSPTAPTPT